MTLLAFLIALPLHLDGHGRAIPRSIGAATAIVALRYERETREAMAVPQ